MANNFTERESYILNNSKHIGWFLEAIDKNNPIHSEEGAAHTESYELDGQNILVPRVRIKNGKAVLNKENALEEALEKGDYIVVPKGEDPDQYSKDLSKLIGKFRGYASGGSVESSPRPQLRPGPTKTGRMTVRNRPVWQNPLTKEIYAEKVVTIPWGDGYATVPSVDGKGTELSREELYKRIVNVKTQLSKKGPVDFITGEDLPVFDTEEDAIKYAMWRSSTMFDKEASDQGFQLDQYELAPEKEDPSFLYDMGSYLKKIIGSSGALGLRKLGFDAYPTENSFAEGGVSMLPAVDDDTRSTEEYLEANKPMDIGSVPFFERPMDASDNDPLVGEDDAGNPVYRTMLGNTYTVRRNPDQRTTRTQIQEDVLPAVKDWLQNPVAPSQDQVLSIGKNIAQSVYDLVSIPADLATGERSASDVTMGEVFDTTGSMALGSSFFNVPGGRDTLRTFGGSSMELDDSELSNFKKARELMKEQISNIDPNQYDRFYWANKRVWDATGWYIDPSDKQWRFEIDDSKSKIDWNNAKIDDITGSELKEYFETIPLEKTGGSSDFVNNLSSISRTVKLSDFFTHDNLYQRYPFLKDLKVEFYNKKDGFGGSYTPGGNLVKININSVDSLDQNDPRFRSVLLHEIQHAIQEREGFSKGANPNYIADDVTRELVEKSDKLKSEAKINIRKNVVDLVNKHNFQNFYDYFPLPSDLDTVGKKTYYDLIDDDEARLLEEMGIEPDLQPELWKLITDTADEYRKHVDAQDLTSNMEFKFYIGADGEVESRLVQATLEDPDYRGTFPLDRANKLMNERDPELYDEFANTPTYRGKVGQGDKSVRTPDIGEADVFITPEKPLSEYLPEIDPSKPGYNMEFTVQDEIKAKTAYIKDLFKNQPKLKKLFNIKPGQKFTLNYEDGPLEVEFRHYSFQYMDKKNLRGEGSIIIGSDYDKLTVPTAVIRYPEGNNRQVSIMELINRSSLVKDFDIQDLRKTQKSPPGFLTNFKKKIGFGSASETYRQNPKVEPEVEAAFTELADIQRGQPELAMVEAQMLYGGGVMPYALEHVGDLTHRMAERGGRYGQEFVKPKVTRLLDSLLSEYGFEKEMLENIQSNARFKYEKDKPDISFEEYKKDYEQSIDKALKKYSEAHKKVPVYNQMQLAGREAAIAIGEKRYTDAIEHLYTIDQAIKDGTYNQVALEFNPDIDFRKKKFARGGMVDKQMQDLFAGSK